VINVAEEGEPEKSGEKERRGYRKGCEEKLRNLNRVYDQILQRFECRYDSGCSRGRESRSVKVEVESEFEVKAKDVAIRTFVF